MIKKYSLLVICIFLATVTVLTGCSYFSPKYQISFDPGQVNPDELKKFEEVRDTLKKSYYQKVDENTLVEGAIAGMADSLQDPYTVYFNKDQMKAFMERSDGSYVGIGITVLMDANGILNVIDTFPGSPAKDAGIIQGDKIVKVDDTDVTGIRDEDIIIGMIKGQENTKVKVAVYRSAQGKQLDFELIRKRIKISNISSEVLDGDLGYIKITMFDSDIASYFEKNLNQLLKKNVKGLIIDLRDNPGGAYDQVVKIADRLLPEGLIVYTKDRNGKGDTEKSGKSDLNLPITVLVNGNSASASEILAGAIKDNKKGKLIGTKTFGKGLVQAVLPLDDGSGLKMTVSRYYTPSGVCIQGIGIQPDEVVDVMEKYKNKPVSQIPRGDDVQLQTAEAVLKAQLQK